MAEAARSQNRGETSPKGKMSSLVGLPLGSVTSRPLLVSWAASRLR